MTNENDLIRRGDVISELSKHAKGTTTLGGQNYQSMTLEVAIDAIEALPAVAASQDADAELLFDAYKGLLVLHRMLDKHGLIVGAETTNKLVDRIVGAHPEFPPRTALRSAVAASQPADPVAKADSCQRVTVKPLVWVGGEILVATGTDIHITSHIIPADMRDEYEAERAARILAAIDTQPDPRDAVIARLVEAGKEVKRLRCITPAARDASWMNHWSNALDDLGEAITAAKGGAA